MEGGGLMSHAGTDEDIGFRVSRVLVLFIYGFAIVCTVMLAMAFFLELFNANEATPFVRWVFRATDRIVQPFRGIFPTVEGEQLALRSGAPFRDVHVLVARARDGCFGRLDRSEDRARQVLGARGRGSRINDSTGYDTRGRQPRRRAPRGGDSQPCGFVLALGRSRHTGVTRSSTVLTAHSTLAA